MSCKWECIPLLELYDVSGGFARPRAVFGSGAFYLDLNTIMENEFIPAEPSASVEASVSELRRFDIRRGDVFLTRTCESVQELALSCTAASDLPNAVYSGFAKRLRPKRPDLLHPFFVGGYFRSAVFRDQVLRAAQAGSGRALLDHGKLEQLTICFPTDIEEQIRIGVPLFGLYEQIAAGASLVLSLSGKINALHPSQRTTPALRAAKGQDIEVLCGLFEQKRALNERKVLILRQLRDRWISREITPP